jgi:hypothetical protein
MVRQRKRRRTFGDKLEDLRDGSVSFEAFCKETAEVWTRMAGYFLRRWPGQAAVAEEDIRQEMLVAAWAAVDRWDEARGVALERYVMYQAGVAAQRCMRAALHCRKRGQAPVWSLPLPECREETIEAAQVDVAIARRVLGRLRGRPGLEGRVALAILRGQTIRECADAAYRDRTMRLRYRFGSETEARVMMEAAARRLERVVAGT